MDYISAFNSLTDGHAMKVPSFAGGYIKRTDIAKTESDTWDSKFKLTYITQNNGTTASASFEFVVEITNGRQDVTGPNTSLVLDPQLFKAIMFDTDWTIGTVDDFEAARTETQQIW